MGGRGFLGAHTGGGKQRKDPSSAKKKKKASKDKRGSQPADEAASYRASQYEVQRADRRAGTGLLIEQLTCEILAWQLCPLLTIDQIHGCRGTSTASKSLFSSDEVWTQICVRSGIAVSVGDLSGTDVWCYFRAASRGVSWAQHLDTALRNARMTSTPPEHPNAPPRPRQSGVMKGACIPLLRLLLNVWV